MGSDNNATGQNLAGWNRFLEYVKKLETANCTFTGLPISQDMFENLTVENVKETGINNACNELGIRVIGPNSHPTEVEEVTGILSGLGVSKASETTVQEALREPFFNCDWFNALDSSSKGVIRIIKDNASGTATGKPDACSKSRPIFMELKTTDWFNCLEQAMDRAYTCLVEYPFFARTVGIAVFGADVSIVVVASCPEGHVNLALVAIPRADVPRLWLHVHEVPLADFLKENSYALKLMLDKFNVHWKRCSLVPIGKSSSSVYLARIYDGPELEFAVKIHTDQDRFNQEAAALSAVGEIYYADEVCSHALYTLDLSQAEAADAWKMVSCGGDPLVLALSVCGDPPRPRMDDSKTPGKLWLSNLPSEIPIPQERSGGLILMHVGKSVKDFAAAYEQLLESLKRLHRANYVHCDIRSPNMMFFPDLGYRLIDYDFARIAGESLTVVKGSGLYEQCPDDILKALETQRDITVAWTKDLDVEMLLMYFMRRDIKPPRNLWESIRNSKK